MDISNLVLSISIPFLITLFGFVLSIQNYHLNKKKANDSDVEKEKEKEARLVRMEADIIYIREAVDGTREKVELLEEKVNKHEQLIASLKSEK